MKTMRLESGHAMPVLGLGTWKLRGEICKTAIKEAFQLGYTHFDTAWVYGNQREIGEALQEIGVERDQLFITSKIASDHLQHDAVLAQCDECLEQLRTDYVDLLLIHWPNEAIPLEETLSAFNKIADAGKAKSIGLSNFGIDQVERARKISEVPISVNQVKYHVRHNPADLLQHCKAHHIVLTAYSPLARGQIQGEPLLKRIAENHEKTPAQVGLRWLLQKGMVVIPKASSKAHMKENLALFDWELTAEEMSEIDNLSK